MTGYGDERLAVEIMKSGAIDYIVKTGSVFDQIPSIVKRALREWDNIQKRLMAEESFRNSEKQLADIISFLPDAVLAIDTTGHVIAWNRAMEEMTKVPADRMLGKGDYEYSIPFYGTRRPILVNLVLEDDPKLDKEYLYVKRSGDKVTGEAFNPNTFGGRGAYLWGTASPLYDSRGTRVGAIEVVRDITIRKQNEEQLVRSEDRFRHISALTTDFTYSCLRHPGESFTLDWMSGAIIAITGFSEEELRSLGCWRCLVAQEDLGVFDEKIAGLLPGQSSDCELRIRTKDGSMKWLLCFAECTLDPGYPAFHRLYGGCRDITVRRNTERALLESEMRFRDLFNNMSSGVVVYERVRGGEDFIIKDMNQASALIERVNKNDVIGRSVLEIFPGVREFGLFAVFQRVAETGTPESHPVSLYHDDRITGWRENHIYKIPSGEIVTIYEDVTEKKQAEEELNAAREWLGIALTAAKAGTWDWNVPSKKLTWSREFYDLFGLDPDKPATFETWLAVLHPDDREPALAMINVSLRKHTYLWNEYRILLPDGTVRWIGAGGSTSYNAAGEPQRMSGLCIDITDRKVAEQKLAATEENYRQIVENSHDAIFIIENGIIRFANTACEDIGRLPIRSILGRKFTDFAIPEEQELLLEDHLEFLKKPTGKRRQVYRLLRGDGTLGWLDVSTVRISWQDCPATLNFATDITEQKRAQDALKESERELSTLMGNLPGMAYRCWNDEHWTMEFVSDGCLELTGYLPSDLVHNATISYNECIHPDERRYVKEEIQAALKKQGKFQVQYRIRTKDGSEKWVWERGVGLSSPDGELSTIEGFIADITEQRRAETALKESEIRFRALVQNSSDIIRILNAEGRITYESPSSERILGYPFGTLLGKDPLDYIHPDDVGRVKQDLSDVYERRNCGIPTEFRIRKDDGEYLWVDTLASNLLGVPGVDGIVVTTRPIDQRKQLELKIQESEERLRLALEGADIASWDWNLATGKAVFSNKFYTMIGYEPGEFEADYITWIALIHPDDRDSVLKTIFEQIRTLRPLCEIEYRIKGKDGMWYWILGRGKIVETDAEGKALRLTGVNIDITSRKLMESEIRSLNTVLEQRVLDRTNDLRQANETLQEEISQRQDAESRLKGSLEEKTVLLKEVHHRVKNNLQIIASLLNLQSRYIHDEATLAAIRESQNRVRAMALVHEKLYRSEDIARIDLAEYVQFLGNGLFQFYDARIRGIRFVTEIHGISVNINEAIPLGLIINELISNSLKYAFPEGKGGEVGILVKYQDTTMEIHYLDNGTGIPEGLDWRNTQSLGLRLVNSLVDQLNGTIELDRSVGTKFVIRIPGRD